MALIGRLYAITSERRLCEELRFDLAYRWFCRLPFDARVPHHSTFSKNRHGRFRDAGIIRLLFEQTVRRCVEAGLVASKDAAIDASFVSADASWQHKMRESDMNVPRLARPVREWLSDEATAPAQEHGVPRGTPAVISRTDPAPAWAARTAKGRFGHAFHVMIDTPGGVAMEVEASPARFAAEVDAGRIMLMRAADRIGYAPDRKAERPIEHLAGFTGVLQVDGYGGYAALARRGDVALALCWSHVRRRFYELAKAGASPVATDVLARIARLYAVEQEVRGRTPDERRAARDEHSRPVIDELRSVLDAKLAQASRKSALAEAIRYALTRWEGLTRFLNDGRVELDSNVAERSIRLLALNRKNALFAGSDHWAVIASLIDTAKLNGVDPPAWLAGTLAQLAAGHSATALDALMP